MVFSRCICYCSPLCSAKPWARYCKDVSAQKMTQPLCLVPNSEFIYYLTLAKEVSQGGGRGGILKAWQLHFSFEILSHNSDSIQAFCSLSYIIRTGEEVKFVKTAAVCTSATAACRASLGSLTSLTIHGEYIRESDCCKEYTQGSGAIHWEKTWYWMHPPVR